jgi:hypothetical protein
MSERRFPQPWSVEEQPALWRATTTDNSLLTFIMRTSRDGDRRLGVYAQAEQHQSRHNERSRDYRDEHPYIGSDGPGPLLL